MNKFDKRVTRCLAIVACSFWVTLAWAYFTNQPEASFFVGTGVVAWGLTILVDVALLGVAFVNGAYAIFNKQIPISYASKKWLAWVLLIFISFYLEVQVDMYLHPFFRR